MVNPTWFYTGVVYALAVWLARRSGVDLPRRIALFFYALVVFFFWLPMTQDYVSLPVDFLKTLPPWTLTTRDHTALNEQMNDLVLQIVPWAHQVRESWKSLTPPLWNHFSGGGYPLLASAQPSALSPLRILGLPLSLGHAMTFEAAMKLLIALTFMFLWCRRRGYSELASATGGVAFGFSSFMAVYLHFPLNSTACFLPAVFYLIDLLAERVTFPRIAASAAVWTFMLFGGHPETVAHTFLLALLYVLWMLVVERAFPFRAALRFLVTLGGAMALAGLLAAPFLVPFAEAMTKSKRFHELKATEGHGAELPFSDWPSAILLLQPHFWGENQQEWREPAHAESISGFAGTLGIVAWFAVLTNIVRTRRWRSREMFFCLAALGAVAVILSWPGVAETFHVIFGLAANARLRLLLVLLLSVQTAAAVDLLRTDRPAILAGVFASAALLLQAFASAYFPNDFSRDTAVIAMVPGLVVLMLATVAGSTARWRYVLTLALLVASIAELWKVSRDWNPVVSSRWLYPKTPMIEALEKLREAIPATEPFRVNGTGATFFPNLSAMYGFEDVRAHDPMANGRYVGVLRHVTGYDSSNYFATWAEWEKTFSDYMNVRYVLTVPWGELPPRYRLVYQGWDGRIFENPQVLPRFFPVRNVIIDFNDPSYYRRLRESDDWGGTAILDKLELENQRMYDDFFTARPPDAPLATMKILDAAPTDYRMHVKAPRYSLVVSSIPWWPGWKVLRNGTRVEPIRVNGAFLGFAVPPGEVDVRVWYDPWTFRVGWILSLTTVAGLIAAGVVLRRRPLGSASSSVAS